MTAWLGNTRAIALRHYLLTTDDDFERAAAGGAESAILVKASAASVVQKAVQKGTEMARNAANLQVEKSRNTKGNGRLRCVATDQGGGHGTRTRNRLPGTSFPMKPLAIRLPSNLEIARYAILPITG